MQYYPLSIQGYLHHRATEHDSFLPTNNKIEIANILLDPIPDTDFATHLLGL